MKEGKVMAQEKICNCKSAEDIITALIPFYCNSFLIPFKVLVSQHTDMCFKQTFDFESLFQFAIQMDFNGDESEVEKAVEKVYGVLEGPNFSETIRNVEYTNEKNVDSMYFEGSFNQEEVSEYAFLLLFNIIIGWYKYLCSYITVNIIMKKLL